MAVAAIPVTTVGWVAMALAAIAVGMPAAVAVVITVEQMARLYQDSSVCDVATTYYVVM